MIEGTEREGGTSGVAMDTGGLSEVIAAPTDDIVAILLDFERYPEWQAVFTEATVLDRDHAGRAQLVEFCVDVKIRKVRYVARYSYDLPRGFSWHLEHGDLKENAGRYTFTPLADGSTEVGVDIRFDPGFYVPGPVKNMVRDQSLRMSMRELRRRVEGAN